MDDIKYLIGLSHFSKFGPIKLKKITNFFSTYKEAYSAGLTAFIKAGIDEKTANEFIAARNDFDINEILETIEKEKIQVIAINDKDYPKLLKEIYNPPVIIYYKGGLDLNNFNTIAVVGTRKFTHYGRQAAENIIQELVKNNIIIISGLALGVDTVAHETCVQNKGKTIAVLGTGIDKNSIYPSANRHLANKIIDSGGAIISEFPLYTQPLKYNFPQRNRIISGLSLGTLVIEAGEKSGALITANYALEQNREVFALPGNIYSSASRGPNNLIKQGAKTVTSANDILETLDLISINHYIENKKIIPESKEEELILPHLSHEPQHINELIRLTKISASAINATMTLMEMKGMVKNVGNMKYILTH